MCKHILEVLVTAGKLGYGPCVFVVVQVQKDCNPVSLFPANIGFL